MALGALGTRRFCGGSHPSVAEHAYLIRRELRGTHPSEEFRRLLAASGFRLNRVILTDFMRLGVVEGVLA
jgi:hypothetical protein